MHTRTLGHEWPRISVIVRARDAASLAAVLAAVRRLDYPDYEMLVVAEHGSATVDDVALALGARIVRIHEGESTHHAAAREARGRLLAFVDEGTLPHRDW